MLLCFATALGAIILSGFVNILAANKDICDLYAVVGQSLTLPLAYEGLSISHVLRWTHNSTIIFYRQQGKVSVGKSDDISATGSLLLKNLQFSSSGAYQANVLNSTGTLAKAWTGRLCVMDMVPKPQLTYMCDPTSSAVTLKCNIAKPQGLVFSWTLDEKTLTSETRQTLSISLAQLKGPKSFRCSVANNVSKERSDTVRPVCKHPPPPTLFCFTSITIAAVLGGATALILLLLIITIILCCRHRHIKLNAQMSCRGELRMISLNKRKPDSISPEYETMQPTDEPSATHASSPPRACYENVSQPEQLTTAAEELRPSPVPKPRTKTPQTPNI